LNGLYWRGADMALARAAAAAGVPFTQSTVSNVRLEEIAAVPGIDHWFQLYLFSQMAMVEQLLARAAGAGVRTLVVTVDANTFGNREWNTRLYAAEARPSFAARLDVLRHPRWLAQVYRHGLPGFPNIAEWLGEGAGDLLQASQWLRRNIAPTVRWEELAQVRRLWSGRMLVKGIGHVADARRAMALGADGVVLGNHGGRQLDGAVSGMDLLAETREALGEKAMVLVEGGIRRGTDLLKAQRLGADAAMGGRATLYGVAVAGEAGAARALAILRQEYERSQILLGDGDVV
jgi:(S)-mandelate dehydrogenase